MQKLKPLFSNPHHTGTQSDVQHCLRLNDLEEVGDGTHYLDFEMLGLFSFRDWTVPEGIRFWMEFLSFLGLSPDTVTLHPDCKDWVSFYDDYSVKIEWDPECLWSDGEIGGYCTEFYIQGVEVGNIVNPLGHCLDCGFGSERLEYFYQQKKGHKVSSPSGSSVLERTINVLLESGVIPSNQKQGYVLRRLIRQQYRSQNPLPSHPCVNKEIERLQKIQSTLPRLKQKNPHQTVEWFWETHGIHPDDW